MTAQETLKRAQAAYDADVGLSLAEFQAVRDVINDAGAPPAVRGALRELGTELQRQADARRERQRVAEEQERGRRHLLALEDREQKWQALDPTAAALLNAIAEMPNDPVLRVLARHLLRPDRGKAPNTFMTELLPEYARVPGFAG